MVYDEEIERSKNNAKKLSGEKPNDEKPKEEKPSLESTGEKIEVGSCEANATAASGNPKATEDKKESDEKMKGVEKESDEKKESNEDIEKQNSEPIKEQIASNPSEANATKRVNEEDPMASEEKKQGDAESLPIPTVDNKNQPLSNTKLETVVEEKVVDIELSELNKPAETENTRATGEKKQGDEESLPIQIVDSEKLKAALKPVPEKEKEKVVPPTTSTKTTQTAA